MKTYDLNLLRVLDALLQTSSVTQAAEQLHLSVPATSHALARLREAAGDPLLVRAGRRLVPTPRALALREPVGRWVQQSASLLQRPGGEDLAALQRIFTVRAPDGIAITLGAAMAVALQKVMPLAQLHFVPENFDTASALREGRIDLDLGGFRPKDPETEVAEMFRLSLVAVVRRGHALAGKTMTAKRYTAQGHVVVPGRSGLRSPVDEALAALGLSRRVVMSVTHANATAFVAAGSDLVATVSERMAQSMAPALGLEVLPLPFVTTTEAVVMAWHPRQTHDAAHTWLRREFQAAARALKSRRAVAAP
ncbi:MAG: LysR family transcriptional regulator [Ramlibacter sp.]|nr:LysR family transcriptional regulator [Ramlibacter sp.]